MSVDQKKKELGRMLRSIRECSGISKYDLGKNEKISKLYERIEHGSVNYGIDELLEYFTFLGVDFDLKFSLNIKLN